MPAINVEHEEDYSIVSVKSRNKKREKTSLRQKQNENIACGKPRNAGLPWTDEAKRNLAAQFEDNKSIKKLAGIFQRTEKAIFAELTKQGLIDQEDI